MAVEARKSVAITNADATPVVPNNPYVMNGVPRTSVGKSNIVTTDSTTSTYRMVRVPSSARIVSIKRTNGAAGATGQVDVGLYKTAADGGAVADSDILKNEAVVETAGFEVELLEIAAADKAKRLWELLALTADPGIMYDVTLTLTEVAAANIDVALEVAWVQ